MTIIFLSVALLAMQMQLNGTQQTTSVLPNHPAILAQDGGKLVKLQNEPGTVLLPWPAPSTSNARSAPWSVDVVNFGPGNVTIKGGPTFSFMLRPKETAHVVVRGSGYVVQK